MGKLTISMAIFNSKPLVITRGYQENPMKDGRVTRKYQEEWNNYRWYIGGSYFF
jgi:hypothetical protein